MNWIYRIGTNEFLHGGPFEVTPLAGESVVTLPRHPILRTERYNGAGGIRPATAQEVVDYDAAQVAERALGRFDDEKLVKAVAIWAAGRFGVPLNTAKSEILAIYKGLA